MPSPSPSPSPLASAFVSCPNPLSACAPDLSSASTESYSYSDSDSDSASASESSSTSSTLSEIGAVDVSKQHLLTAYLCSADPISEAALARMSKYDPALVDMMQFMKWAHKDTGYAGTVAFQLKYEDGQQRMCVVRVERPSDAPPSVTIYDSAPADGQISATVTMPRDVFFGVYMGHIQPQTAYLAGTLQVPFLSFREVANFAGCFDSSRQKWTTFYEMRDGLDSNSIPVSSSASMTHSLSSMLMSLSSSSDTSHLRTLAPLTSPMVFPSPIYSYLLHSDRLSSSTSTSTLNYNHASILSLLSHSSGYPLPWLQSKSITSTTTSSTTTQDDEDEMDSVSFSITTCPVHDMMITSHRPRLQRIMTRTPASAQDAWYTDILSLSCSSSSFSHAPHPPSLFTPSISLSSRLHHTIRTPAFARHIEPTTPPHVEPIASAITIVKQHARKSRAIQLFKKKAQLIRRDSSELYQSTSRTIATALEATRQHFRMISTSLRYDVCDAEHRVAQIPSIRSRPRKHRPPPSSSTSEESDSSTPPPFLS